MFIRTVNGQRLVLVKVPVQKQQALQRYVIALVHPFVVTRLCLMRALGFKPTIVEAVTIARIVQSAWVKVGIHGGLSPALTRKVSAGMVQHLQLTAGIKDSVSQPQLTVAPDITRVLCEQQGHTVKTGATKSYRLTIDDWGSELVPPSSIAVRQVEAWRIFSNAYYADVGVPNPISSPTLTAMPHLQLVHDVIEEQVEALQHVLVGRVPTDDIGRVQQQYATILNVSLEAKVLGVVYPCGLRKSNIAVLTALEEFLRLGDGASVWMILPTLELCTNFTRDNVFLAEMTTKYGLRACHYRAGVDGSRAHLVVACAESLDLDTMDGGLKPPHVLIVDELDTVWADNAWRSSTLDVARRLLARNTRLRVCMLAGALPQVVLGAIVSRVVGESEHVC